MERRSETFYVTTPIYYLNGPPHFAHAYTSVAADAFARFNRIDGKTVHFLTGTDEHGQKVAQAARAAGEPPQEYCDRASAKFREMSGLVNLSNDDFIRTTDERHIRASRALWDAIAANGDIYREEFSGWYAVADEAFYDESELIGGKAPTGADVILLREENYFFRLSRWQDRLLEFYAANPDFIQPISRANEIKSFVRSGLRDLSISRTSVKWGIPVPGDQQHTIYVWLDALTNYLTGAGYPDTSSEIWRKFWPANLHIIGKDILRFHCIYWPAFLMSAGIEPPKCVYAHGWWTVEGAKMSKSANNFVPPAELVEKYGVDAVRYFMLRELPFGADGDLSCRALVTRVNAELANDLGNLAYRVLTIVARRCGGRLPKEANLSVDDRLLLTKATDMIELVRSHMHRYAPHRALEAIWAVVGACNQYISLQAPWTLDASQASRLGTVLYVAADALRHVGVALQPFVPATAAELLDQLAVPDTERTLEVLMNKKLGSDQPLPAPRVLFRKLDTDDPIDIRDSD